MHLRGQNHSGCAVVHLHKDGNVDAANTQSHRLASCSPLSHSLPPCLCVPAAWWFVQASKTLTKLQKEQQLIKSLYNVDANPDVDQDLQEYLKVRQCV